MYHKIPYKTFVAYMKNIFQIIRVKICYNKRATNFSGIYWIFSTQLELASFAFLWVKTKHTVLTHFTGYASKRNSTFCLPFAFFFVCVANWKILRQKLWQKQSNYVANWVGFWWEGEWCAATATSCVTIRARPAQAKHSSSSSPHLLLPAASMKYLCHSQRRPKIEIKIASAAKRGEGGVWLSDWGG